MAKTDVQLTAQADIIKNETAAGANTATRVGTMLDDIIANKINNDKIVTTLGGGSDENVPSEKVVSDALAAKQNALGFTPENVANKENTTIDTSTTKYPTVNLLKTGLDSKQNVLGFTPENVANKDTDWNLAANSDTKYPSQKAVKTYVDGNVVGLLDDRGNYDASSNLFPSTGGSGVAGAIMKGDLWYISVGGTLGGNSVLVGYSIRALVDTPAQTSANWAISNVGLGFVPENVLNKSTDGTLSSNSDTLYPSQKAVKTYADTKQEALVSGTNIKTINGNSLLGSGNLTISGGGGGDSYEAFTVNSSSTKNISAKVNYVTPSGSNARCYMPATPTLGQQHIIYNSDATLTVNVFSQSPALFLQDFSGGGGSNSVGIAAGYFMVCQYVGDDKWFYRLEMNVYNPFNMATKTYVTNAIDAAIPYKRYKAILTNSGISSPLNIVELENTIGAISGVNTGSVGIFELSSAGLFTANKTFVLIGNAYGDDYKTQLRAWRNSDNNILIYNYYNGVLDASGFTQVSIEINIAP